VVGEGREKASGSDRIPVRRFARHRLGEGHGECWRRLDVVEFVVAGSALKRDHWVELFRNSYVRRSRESVGL